MTDNKRNEGGGLLQLFKGEEEQKVGGNRDTLDGHHHTSREKQPTYTKE